MDSNTENKQLNHVRIGMGTRVRNVIVYCNNLIKEKNFRDLHFSAIGGAIGKLISTVEVLKIVNPGFYQVNKIGTIAYQTLDSHNNISNQRLYPKLEVVLSLNEPTEKNEGFQDKLSEEERVKLFELHSRRKPVREGEEDQRGPRRGRGEPRGRGFRGGRGAPRGRGFRGGRGAPRGSFRGGRGAPRGEFRGGRGAPRGEFRGRGTYGARPQNRSRFNSTNESRPRLNRGRGRGRGSELRGGRP